MSPVRTTYPPTWTPPPFRPSTGRQRLIPRGTGAGEGGPIDRIGTITLVVNPPGQIAAGQTVTITAIRTGGSAPLTYAWAGPPGTAAPVSGTSNSISWAAQAGDSGTYTCTVTSVGATDSPVSRGISITVTTPSVAYAILMEDGGFILLEDSGHILLET